MYKYIKNLITQVYTYYYSGNHYEFQLLHGEQDALELSDEILNTVFLHFSRLVQVIGNILCGRFSEKQELLEAFSVFIIPSYRKSVATVTRFC